MMMSNQGAMMMSPGMPGMPPVQEFDEESFRRQLIAEKEAKDAVRHKKGREVYKNLQQKRDHEGTSNCIYWVIAFDLIGCGMIGYSMTGDEWGKVTFTGTGVKTMSIRTGMFDIDVQIHCGKNWLEDQFCHVAQKWAGKGSLNHFLGIACSIPGSSSCAEFEKIGSANTIVICSFGWCCVCLLISVVCAHFYWHKDHSARWRKRSYVFGLMGAVSFLLAMVIWTVIMPDIGNMPRTWTALSGNIVGFKPLQAPPYGSDFTVAAFGTLVLVIVNAMMPCNMAPHPKEEDDEDAQYGRMESLEERLEIAKYGGGDYGSNADTIQQGPPPMMAGGYGGGGMMVAGGYGGGADFGVNGPAGAYGGQMMPGQVMPGQVGPMGTPMY